MTPHAQARRSASGGPGLRSLEGGGSESAGGGRGPSGRKPTLVSVNGGGTRRIGTRRSAATKRTAGTGRMQKGESPKERGERTRARIAEAVIDLLAESELPPTAKEIAARAAVSVRLVFHHFEDMDALYRAVARSQIERHWLSIRPVPRGLPVGQRIDRTVQRRARLFEAVTPVRRKAIALATRHQDVAQGLELTDTMLRTWLEETFADELRAAGRHRLELLAALEAAASWEAWDRLRRVQGLPNAAARRVVARTLRALLDA